MYIVCQRCLASELYKLGSPKQQTALTLNDLKRVSLQLDLAQLVVSADLGQAEPSHLRLAPASVVSCWGGWGLADCWLGALVGPLILRWLSPGFDMAAGFQEHWERELPHVRVGQVSAISHS